MGGVKKELQVRRRMRDKEVKNDDCGKFQKSWLDNFLNSSTDRSNQKIETHSKRAYFQKWNVSIWRYSLIRPFKK